MKKTLLIIFSLLALNSAYGQVKTIPVQNISHDSLSRYTGIWMGFCFPDSINPKPKSKARLFWRIHRIDTVKNEIEITQTGDRFDNAAKIVQTKKRIYKMQFDKSGFWITLLGGLPNSRYKLHFSRSRFQDFTAMKGIFKRIDRKESDLLFVFAKISDDTSDYVKPEGEVQVIVQPPPPIK